MDRFTLLARLYTNQLDPDDQLRLDAADTTAVFENQFRYVEQQIAETKFAPLKSEQFIFFDSRAPSGSKTITHRTVTHVGHADWVDEHANDLPRADVNTREDEVAVKPLGVQYEYSVFDIKRAAIDSTARLDVERKKSAVKAADRKHDEVAAIGSTKHGKKGFLNSTAVPTVTPITGDWTNPATTVDEIVADFLKLIRNVVVTTEENYEVTDVCMPTEQFQVLNTRKYGVDTDKTIRKWLLENVDGLKSISSWNRLAGLGAGSTDRVVAFHKSPEVAKYHAVSRFVEEAPQRKGLAFVVPCHGESGFTEIRIPGAMAYMDGI